jgi:D-amino-acid oxidase
MREVDYEVLVVGGGVLGLTAAVRLQQEIRARIRIWTADAPEDTVSSVAAALWYPYRAYPEAQVTEWGRSTYEQFVELAREPATGVRMVPGIEVWRRPVPDPPWADAVPGLRRCRPDELPPGFRDGHLFAVPVANMRVYLGFLVDCFAAAGGTLERRRISSLDEARAACSLVINCSGLGARTLVPDPEVFPIRGQIVRVTNPGIERFWLDEEHPDGVTYIVPRGEDCILGGTAEDGEWDTTPDPAAGEGILRRCAELEPRLLDARVLEHRVGLRPGRPAIRLEAEHFRDGTRVIHCYGHGGSGVTLSWGCADEVADLARQFLA